MDRKTALGSDPVRRGAEEILATCGGILDTRGKQHRNTTLEDDGALTGRHPVDMLLAMMEMKISRLRGQIEIIRIDNPDVWEDEEALAVLLANAVTLDTIMDLINYVALMYGRVMVVDCLAGKKK